MLHIPEVAVEKDTPSLSFGWALQERNMIEGEDGVFYDADGVRYHRIGEMGHYKYEEINSVFEGDPSQMTDAIVTSALEHSDLGTPSKTRTQLEQHQLENEEGQEVGIQSSTVIPETPQTTQD